jgi:hyperosmotically inducible protein
MNSARYTAPLSFRLVAASMLAAGMLAAGMLAAGCSPGYRSDGDSNDLRRDLDDRTIESRVRVAIGSDEQTADENFKVESEDGVVYLRGTVRTPVAARRAVALAAGVDGVRRVMDRTRTVRE